MFSPQRQRHFHIPGGIFDLVSDDGQVSDYSRASTSPISPTVKTPVEVQSIAHLDASDIARFISYIRHPLASQTAEFSKALNISGSALRGLERPSLSRLANHDPQLEDELARIQLGLLPYEPIPEGVSESSTGSTEPLVNETEAKSSANNSQSQIQPSPSPPARTTQLAETGSETGSAQELVVVTTSSTEESSTTAPTDEQTKSDDSASPDSEPSSDSGDGSNSASAETSSSGLENGPSDKNQGPSIPSSHVRPPSPSIAQGGDGQTSVVEPELDSGQDTTNQASTSEAAAFEHVSSTSDEVQAPHTQHTQGDHDEFTALDTDTSDVDGKPVVLSPNTAAFMALLEAPATEEVEREPSGLGDWTDNPYGPGPVVDDPPADATATVTATEEPASSQGTSPPDDSPPAQNTDNTSRAQDTIPDPSLGSDHSELLSKDVVSAGGNVDADVEIGPASHVQSATDDILESGSGTLEGEAAGAQLPVLNITTDSDPAQLNANWHDAGQYTSSPEDSILATPSASPDVSPSSARSFIRKTAPADSVPKLNPLLDLDLLRLPAFSFGETDFDGRRRSSGAVDDPAVSTMLFQEISSVQKDKLLDFSEQDDSEGRTEHSAEISVSGTIETSGAASSLKSDQAYKAPNVDLRPPRLGITIPVSPTSLHQDLFEASPLLFSPISSVASALPFAALKYDQDKPSRRAWSATEPGLQFPTSPLAFPPSRDSFLMSSENDSRLVKLKRRHARQPPPPAKQPEQPRYSSQGTDTTGLDREDSPPPEIIRTYSDAGVQTEGVAVASEDWRDLHVESLRHRVEALERELRQARSSPTTSTSRRSSRSDSANWREDRERIGVQHTREPPAYVQSYSAPRALFVRAASTDRQVPPPAPISFNFRNISAGSFLGGGSSSRSGHGHHRSSSSS
ncbi:hypothetical protein MIND_00205300 [Mycena indigotica]|uniref:Uncharacterized protein n=1 Tax=Mycena indigotica TaxID=2126181 RepID=A0A8H6WAU3_9AGAR|nr:uncharacterized protein MIND_00205300 [Mycena indigotica]KAF7311939.1 hypothetical protein MIND_00205300 [Mycena indigotica]